MNHMGGVRSPPRGPMSLTGSDVSQSIEKNYNFLMFQYRFIHWTGKGILTVLRGNYEILETALRFPDLFILFLYY